MCATILRPGAPVYVFDGGNLGVEFAYGDPSVNVHPTDITDKKILDGRLRACDCGRRQSRPDKFWIYVSLRLVWWKSPSSVVFPN